MFVILASRDSPISLSLGNQGEPAAVAVSIYTLTSPGPYGIHWFIPLLLYSASFGSQEGKEMIAQTTSVLLAKGT